MMQWNTSVDIGGRAIAVTPENWIGGVVLLDDGEGPEWHITKAYLTVPPPEMGTIGTLAASYYPLFQFDDYDWGFTAANCAPILPPPTLLRAGEPCWSDALAALALLPGAERYPFERLTRCDYVKIPAEAGDFGVSFYHGEKQLRLVYANHLAGLDDNYEARGRDWQREGVIRQYLQQVALQAQSVEVAS